MASNTSLLPTIANIFRTGFQEYVDTYGPLPFEYYKIAHDIMACRTDELDGHRYQCDSCNHEIILYNSCRNRHCPQCQAYATAQWAQQRIEQAVPAGYFHVVFTVPEQLNAFALRNKKAFYSLLFRSVKETLSELANDKKRLGAHIGFICVLHTWGQTLIEHTHIHVIIPAGGLSFDKKKWKQCKKKYLFPVAVMRTLFKGKIMAYFIEAVNNGTIGFHGILKKYQDDKRHKALIDNLYKMKWVVYIKPAFENPEAVIKYLSNYTHRIAITNKRILKLENGSVTFSYKDYKDKGKEKIMTLTVVEFLRRFMLHAMPKGFMRIRHYGFLANKNRKKVLPIVMKLLKKKVKKKQSLQNKWHEIIEKITGMDPRICQLCKKGKMRLIEEIPKMQHIMKNENDRTVLPAA